MLIPHEMFNVFGVSIQSLISISYFISTPNPTEPFVPESSHLFLNKL